MSEIVIRELLRKGYKIELNGVSNHTKDKKSRVIFLDDIPDDTDDIKFTKDIPSWKRMCYCILKMTICVDLWDLVLQKNRELERNILRRNMKNSLDRS